MKSPDHQDGRSGPPRGLDEVRRQLRDLGYLRTPVDRFLLGGPRRLAARGAAITSAAARVAVVGSPILGGLLLLVLLVHNYPHLNRVRDAAVLYLYSVLVSGCFLFLVHILGSLVVIRKGWRAGRDLPVAVARGVGFGLAALLGLHLGWRWLGASAGSEHLTTPVRLGFLAGILGVGIWIGSVLARGLIGTLVRGADHPGVAARKRGHATWATLTFLPVAFLLLIWILLPGRPAVPAVAGVPEVRPLAVDGRMILIGVDGLDRAGLREAWTGPQVTVSLEPVSAKEPPAVWTSLMTGFPPGRHGIHSVESLQLMGIRTPLRELYLLRPLQDSLNLLIPGLAPVERRPVNACNRLVKTIWEILGEYGRRPAALNWWATWPASGGGGGVLVTERAYFKLLQGGVPEGETRPAGLFEDIRTGFPAAQAERHRRAESLLAGTNLGEHDRALLIRSLVGDMFQLETGWKLAGGGEIDDLFIYLPGLDIARTELLGRPGPDSASGFRRGLEILDSYYRFLAGWVDRFASGLGPSDLLLVVGDPGRERSLQSTDPRDGWPVLALGYRGTGPERVPVPHPGSLDLTPTILALRGFPLSREMPGAPLFRIRGLAPGAIPSFGSHACEAASAEKSTFDPEMLEQLRSLGYLH